MRKIPKKDLLLIVHTIICLKNPSIREINIMAMAKEILELREKAKPSCGRRDFHICTPALHGKK
jgi:hypothetical protein